MWVPRFVGGFRATPTGKPPVWESPFGESTSLTSPLSSPLWARSFSLASLEAWLGLSFFSSGRGAPGPAKRLEFPRCRGKTAKGPPAQLGPIPIFFCHCTHLLRTDPIFCSALPTFFWVKGRKNGIGPLALWGSRKGGVVLRIVSRNPFASRASGIRNQLVSGGFPCKYQGTMVSTMVAKWCRIPSIHRMNQPLVD